MYEKELRAATVPAELKNYIGDYYRALVERDKKGLLGRAELLCFTRFLDLAKKYRFAADEMATMFKFSNLLIYVDQDGKAKHLELYPAQKFIMCGIFGLRRPDGGYLVNTANIYVARRNGKSFLLSGVLHYLMTMSKYRNENIILASCKGQNAEICFDEFVKFIDNDPYLAETYTNVNRTACWAKSRITNNKLDMFRTGSGAKKSLDGFTNRVAVIDEEMLCDEIITKTIQDGQGHYKDKLLVTMSTAQFEIGGTNHKKWLSLEKNLFEGTLPDENFLFLCEPDKEDIAKKDFSSIKVWGKANPVLLFQQDGYTVKDYIKSSYTAKARAANEVKGFELQSFATKQCNVWYSAEDRGLCTFEQMKACGAPVGFADVVGNGYKDWYLGIDLSHTLDLTSVWFGAIVKEQDGKILKAGNLKGTPRMFCHVVSWMPKNKLQMHVDADKFPYRDYVDKELFLCTGGGGENIDAGQVLEYIRATMEKYGLHYVTIAADPYGIAGIQEQLAEMCDTFILQNQSPKALSQYIEILSGLWKDKAIIYSAGNEDILEKAMMNAVMVKNPTGYYSLEKISLRADSNVRIDPVDAMLTGFIAPYIDWNRGDVDGNEIVDDWLEMVRGE